MIDVLVAPLVVLIWLSLFGVIIAIPLLPIMLVGLAVEGVRNAARRHRERLLALRACDSDRFLTLERLREQFALGRLTLPELEQRTDDALAVQTPDELLGLVADLPPTEPRAAYVLCWLRLAAAIDLGAGGLVAAAAPSGGWRFLGVILAVSGFALAHVARDPVRRAQLLAIVLLGKLATAAAVAVALTAGVAALGLDVVCWPVLGGFLREAVQSAGGWRSFAGGAKPGASAL